jgi:hypothetical protein
MSKASCPVENLISSQYCQLSVCMECGIVNLNLPSRISLQFGTSQFLEIASNFHKAALILKAKTEPKQKSAKIIKLTLFH